MSRFRHIDVVARVLLFSQLLDLASTRAQDYSSTCVAVSVKPSDTTATDAIHLTWFDRLTQVCSGSLF